MKKWTLSFFSAIILTGFIFFEIDLLAQDASSGVSIYEDITTKVNNARKSGKSSKRISELFLWGAGKCRDAGADAYRYTIALFEAAIKENSDNARALQVYGDYLFGYRGLYEQAAAKYYKAQKLIEQNPGDYNDNLKHNLRRSIKILHRDGNDGVELFESDIVSAYLEPSGEYREPSSDDPELLSLLFQNLNANRIADDQAAVAIKSTIPKNLKRRREEIEYAGKLFFRFRNKHLPSLRFSWNQIDITSGSTRLSGSDFIPTDQEFHDYSALLVKNVFVKHNFDLKLQATYSKRELKTEAVFVEEDSEILDVESVLSHYFNFNTLKLTLGGNVADIDRKNPELKEDDSHSLRAGLRLSLFQTSENTENSERFRGRRSTHFEVGIRRSKRFAAGNNTATFPGNAQIDYIPNAGIEYLGLMKGYLDLSFSYQMIQRDVTDRPNEGHYKAQQLRLIPTWVEIYKLYDNDFKHGFEFLTLSLPLTLVIDNEDGNYTRFGAAAELKTQWVSKLCGIRLSPNIKIDWAHYTELNRDDWGVFVGGKLSL